jgi:uncharacterized protein DUF2550
MMIVSCEARLRSARAEQAGQGTVTDVIELAMSPDALTGYLAWLEAAPASYLSEAS